MPRRPPVAGASWALINTRYRFLREELFLRISCPLHLESTDLGRDMAHECKVLRHKASVTLDQSTSHFWRQSTAPLETESCLFGFTISSVKICMRHET